MDRLSCMAAFVRVVEDGSFARAADRLGISTSACSRYVSELEAHLDTRLLHRTTRRLSLTEAGEAFVARCRQILGDVEDAEQAASAHSSALRGAIRLTAPYHFAREYLAPVIAAFHLRHADVDFDIQLGDHAVDLVEEGIDLAIRIGHLATETMIARPLAETRLVICAAPEYLERHGRPRVPADLVAHACLTYAHASTGAIWPFTHSDGRVEEVRIRSGIRANNGDMMVALALQGLGITPVPEFVVHDDLDTGRLERVLPEFPGTPLGIYAVYPSRRHLSARVRLFIDFLASEFASGAPAVRPPARAVESNA